MTAFQQECRRVVARLLDRFDIVVGDEGWRPIASAATGADAQLRTAFVFGGRTYELYLYADETGAKIDRNWYTLERQDYDSPEELIGVFRNFLRGCLEGSSPPEALRLARRGK